MTIETIIDQLRSATESNRRIDTMIARFLADRGGYSPPTAPIDIPHYTGGLDSAYSLVEMFFPGRAGGCAWDERGCRAQIGDGPKYEGTTPPLALCAAVFGELGRRRKNAK